MNIIRSEKFANYPELIFGLSTKDGGVSPEPFCMNLSVATNDKKENVWKNREIFFNELGIEPAKVNFQKQVHSTVSHHILSPGFAGECDGTFTDKLDVFLTVSVADCLPIFIYEPEKKIIAAIHAGWRGTVREISKKIIYKLVHEFDANAAKMIVFAGPCISQDKFEVGEEVAIQFSDDVKIFHKNKYCIDLRKENHRQLLECGIEEANIEHNSLCTFSEDKLLHSYRRDRDRSGRMFGVIGIKKILNPIASSDHERSQSVN